MGLIYKNVSDFFLFFFLLPMLESLKEHGEEVPVIQEECHGGIVISEATFKLAKWKF